MTVSAPRHASLRAGWARRFTLLALLLVGATAARAQTHEDWSYNKAVYEVNLRHYTAAGTLAAFAPHLPRLADMGAGILWFMPMHPVGQQNRLGTQGSPYAVRDFLAVHPQYGTMADFKAVVDQAHALGLRVIIDWVANHTAWDNTLTTTHPEWYVRDSQGRFIPPPGTNWSDVIELDYSKPELRAYMIEAMQHWVRETGIDGFRFDAVDFVPMDFWQQATAALKATKPDLLLLAESDGTQWHAAGFDMTYGWGLYGFGNGVLRDIVRGTKGAAHLHVYAANQATYPASAYRMYFTANHDENAWYGTTAELFGAAAPAFAVLTATFHGLPLVFNGQEAGLNRRLQLFEKDQIPWQSHPNTALYTSLLTLKARNRALWNGRRGGPFQRVFTSDDARVFAFLRERDGDRVLVAINVSAQPVTATLGGDTWAGTYRDAFTGQTVTLQTGASVALPAWGYAVYEARTATAAEGADDPAGAPSLRVLPHPVRAQARIAYTLPAPGPAVLTVTDLLGREVWRRSVAYAAAGPHEAVFDAAGRPAGTYVVRVESGRHRETRRFVLQP